MLSEDERARVREAVAKAEAGLSAEIVPCVYEQSSPYPETLWAGGCAGAALASAALLLVDWFSPLWLPVSTQMLAVPVAALAGAALGRWSRAFKRRMLGERRMEEAVARRAKEVFYDRGLSGTARREAVLVYASLLERRVVVLADRAVSARVEPKAWEDAVAAMTAAAREGRVADGLVAAVEKAAEALHGAGFGGPGGGELPDEPVVEDDA